MLFRSASIDEEKKNKYQNEETRLLSSVLRFLHYRFVLNGAAPREETTAFDHRAAVQGVQDYPDAVESVHWVWTLVRAEGKKGAGALKASGISFPYLMVAHFLASMSNAKKDTKNSSGWKITDADFDKAGDFVTLLIYGEVEGLEGQLKKHKLLSQIRSALSAKEGQVDANGKPPTHYFAEGNAGLNAKFHALGWAWRDYAELPIDEKKVNIATICSGSAGFARYTDGPSGKVFDILPEPKAPKAADVRAAAAKAESPAAPAAPAARRSPPRRAAS